MLYKKSMIAMLVIGWMGIVSSVEALEIKNLSHAVDVAGKQRMYTQRLLKDYTMIGMHNTFGNPKKDLEQTIAAFTDHMQSLYAFATDETTRKSIEVSQKLWIPVKTMLAETPTKENAKILQVKLEELLHAADKTTKHFAKLTGKQSGEIINISGRQRMLSQRIAGLYMMQSWGIEDPEFKDKMAVSMKLFKTSLEKLLAYKKNTQEITMLLKKVKRNFMFFEMMQGSKVFIPSLLYKKSMAILKDMNSATGLYAEIGASES